jgi:hypothetical protein
VPAQVAHAERAAGDALGGAAEGRQLLLAYYLAGRAACLPGITYVRMLAYMVALDAVCWGCA